MKKTRQHLNRCIKRAAEIHGIEWGRVTCKKEFGDKYREFITNTLDEINRDEDLRSLVTHSYILSKLGDLNYIYGTNYCENIHILHERFNRFLAALLVEKKKDEDKKTFTMDDWNYAMYVLKLFYDF